MHARIKLKSSLLLASIFLLSVASFFTGLPQATSLTSYLTAQDAGRLRIAKIYPGAGSVLSFIEDKMGTIDTKRQIIDYAVNRLHANAVMIGWRRQPVSWDPRDQLESPLNSGVLNPSYLKHLDEWVSLAKEYNVYVIFEEWFSPMRAQANGYWTGFDDWTFHDQWANFYNVLATHYRGDASIAGFLPGEETVVNDTWPYADSGTREFNDLWNQVMTKLSTAVHQADPNFNFIAMPTIDWSGGSYTLGSKARYPNAWQPLTDPNPHVLYRVMWNPRDPIKTGALYPFDGGLYNGAMNWHQETGLPITVEALVDWRDPNQWTWDSAGLQWERDLLAAMDSKGIGMNFGTYESSTDTYSTHDELAHERAWVQVYSERTNQQDATPPTVSIASPANGAIISGKVTVNVSASDNVGLRSVELYKDETLIANKTGGSSLSYSWDTTADQQGFHSLVAKAYDSANNVRVSNTITVSVDNGPPNVSIISPAPGANVTARDPVTISVSASDASGIGRVEFYVDGKLEATIYSQPYTYQWSTKSVKKGVHTILVVAYDSAGNAGQAYTTITLANLSVTRRT